MVSRNDFYNQIDKLLDKNMDVYGKIKESKTLITLILSNANKILNRYMNKGYQIGGYRILNENKIDKDIFNYIYSNNGKMYHISSKKGQLILANYLIYYYINQ